MLYIQTTSVSRSTQPTPIPSDVAQLLVFALVQDHSPFPSRRPSFGVLEQDPGSSRPVLLLELGENHFLAQERLLGGFARFGDGPLKVGFFGRGGGVDVVAIQT